MHSDLEVGLPAGSGVATYPPGASFGLRLLRDYEFVWMIEGDAEYRRGGDAVAAPAGSLVLCRPGEAESIADFFQWDRHRRTRHGYFHFQIHAFPGDWPPTDRWPVVRPLPPDDVARPLFHHLLTWQDKEDARQCRLTIAALLSVFLSGDLAAGGVERETWPEPVERACDFLYRSLEAEPARRRSLSQLAQAACVTPEHLCRLFRVSVGHSPAETVRLARLDRAATLLARSNYSVGEISDLCGFASAFHFSRLFRSAFGLPPTAMRRAVQGGSPPPLPRLLRRAPL